MKVKVLWMFQKKSWRQKFMTSSLNSKKVPRIGSAPNWLLSWCNPGAYLWRMSNSADIQSTHLSLELMSGHKYRVKWCAILSVIWTVRTLRKRILYDISVYRMISKSIFILLVFSYLFSCPFSHNAILLQHRKQPIRWGDSHMTPL